MGMQTLGMNSCYASCIESHCVSITCRAYMHFRRRFWSVVSAIYHPVILGLPCSIFLRNVIFPFSFFLFLWVCLRVRVDVCISVQAMKHLAHVKNALCYFSILLNLKCFWCYDVIPSYVLGIILFLATPQRQTMVTRDNDLCTVLHYEQF